MKLTFVMLCLAVAGVATANSRGIPENPNANNAALLIPVSHGLPGLGIDIENMKRILGHEANNFAVTALKDKEGTVSRIATELTRHADSVDSRGTLFFYFTGHGGRGIISAQDRTMRISEIRAAVEEGRKNWGPLKRLVMFFDSCHSGSLLDPLRPWSWLDNGGFSSQILADSIFEGMSVDENGRESTYWSSLFVFASARADETCQASGAGSAFTLGVKKGWDKVLAAKGTVGDFVKATQQGTSGSHPVARFEPASLESEKLVMD